MKIFFKLLLIIYLYGYLFLCSPVFAKAIFVDSVDPPPGFESAHATQHLRVSVFFMHQNIGFFYVDIQKGRLKFHSPEQLLSQLVDIKKNNEIRHVLNQSFSLNVDCYAEVSKTCEKLKTKDAYIIYSPDQQTVYLNLATLYYKKPKAEGLIEFIPNAPPRWSYINKLGAAGSYSSEEPRFASRIYPSFPDYYNLYSNNIFAFGNTSFINNMSQNNGIDHDQHFQIQNLYAQHIIQDKIYTSGYIVNPTTPFFQTQTILGGSIRTTLDTVKNSEMLLATPLVIFVPQASQVNIFRNGQLIYSQYLEGGYQRINTRGFPEGGYELLIKIGNNNTIRRFFSKGFSLPPVDFPQYYLIAGYLTNGMILNDNGYDVLPHVLNRPVFQSGISKRMNEQTALFGDVLFDSHQGLIDFGLAFFLKNAFVKTAGLVTTKNNTGIYAMLNTQKNAININLIATKIFYSKKNLEYFFLNDLVDNHSISISYRLSDIDMVGIQANYNKNLEQPHSYSAGAFYQRWIGNYKGMGLFFNAAYNKAIYVGDTYSLSLSVNFSHDRLSGTEALSWQNQMNNHHNQPLASPMVLQGSTVYSHQNDQDIGYALNEIHTFSPNVSSLAGTYNDTGQQGFIAAYANYNHMKDAGHSVGYGGNVETEFVLNQYGALFNGVDRGNTSGMIIEADANDSKDELSKFALLDDNNRKIAIFPPNKKIFVSLPQFTDKNYTLVNLSKSDYFIKEAVRHVTLYIGNVGYYAWPVEKRIIVIGRAVTKHKKPLTNAWIDSGNNGIFSDNEGYFQLELSQNTRILSVGKRCKIQLPKLNRDKAYLYIGDVRCS